VIRVEGPGAAEWLAEQGRRLVVEEVNDPAEVARFTAQYEQAERNRLWLEDHWPDLLPGALGKFVAVAGQEAFVADDPVAAREAAVAAHPQDRGVLVQFVRPEKGPRIYAARRSMVPVS
jgi:hypothetical protein